MKRTLIAAASLAALAAGSLLAPAKAASSVSIGSVTVSNGKATVTGSASFDAVSGAQDIGGSVVNGIAAPQAADAAGVQLTKAKIAQLANGAGLRFIWELNSLPAQTPPEAVRYTWSFLIGTTQYQLQAKRTNLASVTTAEDPLGHVKQAAGQKNFFQLRGACQTSYEGSPVSGCYHLAFLNGSIDPATKTVSIDLPYETRDQIGRLVAPDFKPGAVLLPNQTAGMSVNAAFQAAVGNTSTSNYINNWSPYFVGNAVQIGVGFADQAPEEVEYTAPATLTGGTFTGSVSLGEDGADTVFARACSGTTCVYTSRPLA